MSNLGWRGLLKEKEEALGAYITQGGLTVPDLLDEDGFNVRFATFYQQSGGVYGRQMQLCNKLKHSCGSIITISQGVSKFASDLSDAQDNGRPESLIWKTSLVALEVGRRYGAGHEAVINLQVELHKTVPRLTNPFTNLNRWSRFSPVQEALKTLYFIFIDLYLKLIKAYKTRSLHQNLLADKAFQTIIDEAEKSFRNAKARYDSSVQSAEQDEVVQAASSNAQADTPSLPLTEFVFQFETLALIGKGSHGNVYKVKEKTTNELYACKDIQMSKPSLRTRTKGEVKDEILLLKKLRHTHIITISNYSEVDTGFSILLEPLADQDLKEFLKDCAKKDFPDDITNMILPWFACLLHALKFAHAENIKHRDIKPANILVKRSHVYLSDFSLGVDFTGQDASVATDEVAAGTMRYRAPETSANGGGGRKADVFSLGCVYSEMFTVVCRKPLEELGNRSKAEHKTDFFRESLPTVKDWLIELKDKSASDMNIKKLWKVIRCMIQEELGMRHTAQEALDLMKKGEAKTPDLSCLHIH